jgi:putative spermidine/putrescine transport system permease protein
VSSRRTSLAPSLGLLPFLGYITVFLLIPTVTVVVGAFQEQGRFSLVNIETLFDPAPLRALGNSILLSGLTAVIGAVFGALLAYLIVTRSPDSLLRRVVLAFAFLATFGFNGLVTLFLHNRLGVDTFAWGGWIYELPGLVLVYTYFQIPLMVVVFIPALEGLRPQWREAAVSIGATTRQYWLQVGIPLLRPAFLGSMLLLFANAFAAYATAAALVSQGSSILPLLIRSALTSEVVLGRQDLAFALALEMIVVVAVVMGAYALLVRRTSRWLR